MNKYQAAALERKRKEAEEKKAAKKAAALAEKKLREEKKTAEKVRHDFVFSLHCFSIPIGISFIDDLWSNIQTCSHMPL